MSGDFSELECKSRPYFDGSPRVNMNEFSSRINTGFLAVISLEQSTGMYVPSVVYEMAICQ